LDNVFSLCLKSQVFTANTNGPPVAILGVTERLKNRRFRCCLIPSRIGIIGIATTINLCQIIKVFTSTDAHVFFKGVIKFALKLLQHVSV